MPGGNRANRLVPPAGCDNGTEGGEGREDGKATAQKLHVKLLARNVPDSAHAQLLEYRTLPSFPPGVDLFISEIKPQFDLPGKVGYFRFFHAAPEGISTACCAVIHTTDRSQSQKTII